MRSSLAFLQGCIRLWRAQKTLMSEAVPACDRSTASDARMNLFLRFETQSGPRTLVTSGVPLRCASEITKAMIVSGQYAEYTDQCTTLPVKELVKLGKRQKNSKSAFEPLSDNIVAIAESRLRAV